MKKTLLIILCTFCHMAWAQKRTFSENKQAQKAYEQARQAVSSNSYDKAVVWLKQAVSYDNKFTAAYQQLGDIYRKLSEYQNAKVNYHKVIETDPEFLSYTYFGLAESELYTGDYNEALIHLKKYISYPGLSQTSRKLAEKYIGDCLFSAEALKSPVPFNPLNLGSNINTSAQEYLPVVTADDEMLIFTRQANGNEDFFKSIKKDNAWLPAVYLSTNINTAEFNEGSQCISPDGLYLFFTGCNRPDGLGRCDIYISKREGQDWSKPFNIGGPVNTAAWESQPSLSADGKTLYFVSNRPGGLGGNDIWKAELQPGGSWSEPVNLGPEINTPYDEQSPFIHTDNQTLYFASKGWPGFGGFDLFMSKKASDGSWSKPQNLGYPINTGSEESGLFVNNDGKTAYFSAKRNDGSGGLDIYSFEMPAKLRPAPVTYVKGFIIDKKTNKPLIAQVRIADVGTGNLIYDAESDEDKGDFLATMPAGKSYALNIEKEGYLLFSQNFSLDKPAAASNPFIISVALQKIEAGGLVVLNNIFFDSNKADLLPESKSELQRLISFLNNNPEVSIEISGHTDNVGDDKANLILSQNRARSVYDFLITNKIATSRLSFKGYGESKPVTDNTTENGRQQNRRTEFKIISK